MLDMHWSGAKHIVRHMQKSDVQWSVISKFTCIMQACFYTSSFVLQMPLEVTRNFVENRDSTYDLYEVPKVQVENMDDSYRSKQTPIRPFELKTFLKVGRYTHYVFLGRPRVGLFQSISNI